MPFEFIAQQEVVTKEETNIWKLKKRVGQGYILKAGETLINIPFEGITAFPNHLKRKQNEQDKIKELTDEMSRLRIRNKTKKEDGKLQQKLEASQRKIEVLRAYNVKLEAGKSSR